jgi:hypothetical protein
MSSRDLNPHTPPDTPRREKRTSRDSASAEQRFVPRKGQFVGRDRPGRTTYFDMKRDIDHGSASAFAHTPTSRSTPRELNARRNLAPESDQDLPASEHNADELRPALQNLDVRPSLPRKQNHTSEQPLPPPPSPTERFPDVSDASTVRTKARSIEPAFKVHTTPEIDVVLVDGNVHVDVRFEFLKKDLMGTDIMVERQKLIAREVRVRAPELLQNALQDEEGKDGSQPGAEAEV